MLSNLNSCHGVFIPTTTTTSSSSSSSSTTTFTTSMNSFATKYCSNSGSTSITSTRHYRSPGHYYHHTPSIKINETKRNKRTVHDENIWAKIEEDFTPELLEEQNMNIPDVIQHSPKQMSSAPLSDIEESQTSDITALVQPASKKLSALFIKPDINVECLYRKSGIRENCEVCSSEVVLTDDGFLTCKNPACSILYKDESLDQSAEWRYYGADDNQNNDPTRCGMPVNPLLKESSYGCKVMCEGGSYSQDMLKIRRYTEWQSMPYREKAQYDMFQKITTLAQNKGISKMIIDEALRVHKRISEHKTFRSLNRDGVVGASIYIACKIHNCPRTPKEIATIFNLDNTSATKGCKNAVSIINELESNLENSEKTNFCKTKPEAFIERYCSRLSINDELTKLCQFIAVMIEKQNLIPENTPHSIASGIIYFVACQCHLSITKKDVNRVSDMSEVTINKCYKKLYDMRDKLIPKMILSKYTTTAAASPA